MVPARVATLLVVAVLALLAVPTAAVAAGPVTVSGTVVRDGAPVTGVQVVVSVTGSDGIASATTDEEGAFAVQVEADAGSQVRIDATGQTSRSDPDSKGCVQLETPTGTLTFMIDAVPPAAVVVPMDDVLTGTVCSPTAAPVVTPNVTPPSTDAARARRSAEASPATLLLVLGTLALLAGGILALDRRRV